MLNYVLKKIKGFFQKNRKQNNIQIDTVKNGNIYQDSIIKVENPAIAISHIKDNPEDLKITLDSISNVLLRQSKSKTLPQGYQVVVKMKDGKADIHSEPRLDFKETASITILGQRITDLIVRVELESDKIVNLDIIREAVKTHKTEQTQISLIPGSNGNHGTRMVVL